MVIHVTYGTGEGVTRLAAFDAALHNAGIANYNLIKLTSIIPEGSTVKIQRLDRNAIGHGQKLYVVACCGEESQPGRWVYVGLGWKCPRGGGGLIAEHRGRSRAEVAGEIEKTLEGAERYRKSGGRIRQKIIGVKCRNSPVCAIVAAVYESEGWKGEL